MNRHIFAAFLVLALSFSACNQDDRTHAMIETEFGNMKIVLYDETPVHRDNFTKLAREGFYDGTLFHRIIKGFMIQGGDPESKTAEAGQQLGGGGTGYTLDPEIGSPHIKGTLAAARLGDHVNPAKKSSGCQFFIVQGSPQSDAQLDFFEKQKNIKYNETQRRLYKEKGGYPSLDMEYTVFGEVV
ncbi:MAG: peptidylprolyl isomerase, partial [Bacteroidota bacterium]